MSREVEIHCRRVVARPKWAVEKIVMVTGYMSRRIENGMRLLLVPALCAGVALASGVGSARAGASGRAVPALALQVRASQGDLAVRGSGTIRATGRGMAVGAPATTPVGSGPHVVVIDAATARAFVLSEDDTLAVLDLKTGAVVRTVSIPGVFSTESQSGPQLLAVDERAGHVFVMSQYGNYVAVLDARSGALLRRTRVASPILLTADPTSGRILVVSTILDLWPRGR